MFISVYTYIYVYMYLCANKLCCSCFGFKNRTVLVYVQATHISTTPPLKLVCQHMGGLMDDERLPIKHSSGSGKEYNRAVGRSLCLWNLLLFAMYCIVTRTSDYWFPPKPRTSPYVVSAAMIVGLMLIIQGLIENTKTGGRIKQWILNFRRGLRREAVIVDRNSIIF